MTLFSIAQRSSKKSLGRTFASVLATSALLVIAPAGCGGPDPETPATTKAAGTLGAGAAAADFTARDIEGKTIKLSTYLGKQAILINFAATWCEPCVAEFPHLRRMYDANKSRGFVILCVAMDGPETVANVPAFARRNQVNFPMLTDEDSRIASLYNPKKSAPLSVLIDKHGKVAAIREGYNPGDEEFLAKDVAKVLDEAPSSQ